MGDGEIREEEVYATSQLPLEIKDSSLPAPLSAPGQPAPSRCLLDIWDASPS
ncbi:hypothetical protein H8959_000602 [Pygathrix nigripes]